MTLANDGRFGIGTSSPQAPLHIATGPDAAPGEGGYLVIGTPFGASLALDDNEILARDRGAMSTLHLQSDGGDVWIHSKGGGATVMIKSEGRLGIGVVDPAHPIHVGGGAHCFAGREWRNASSISCKKDVEALSLDDALATLDDLRPVTFKYIDDDEVRAGFIAEDVPDLVAAGDRQSLSAMDFVAVLTRVVQFQQRQISELSRASGHSREGISPIGRSAQEEEMSAEPVKRSQYFSPPTTECPHSSRNHFEDWEEFHLPMARMHHAALHGRGVASGLAVSVQDAGTQIEVGPGVAIDGKGELIALSAAGQADSGGEQPGEAGQQIDPPFRLGIAGRDPGTYYLCIQFAQALRFGEGSCGKLEQTPILRLLPSAGDPGPIEAGEAIVLAIVEVDATGVATVRDRAEGLPHRRQLVGQWGSELLIRRTGTAAEAVADAPAARIGARDGGGLRFSVADAADAIILDREDGGQFSRLEVQADEARLAGNVEVLGSLGLAGWRLQPGGSEVDPTLDLRPPADERSFRVVAHDGGHVPLQVRPSSAGDGNAVYLAQTGGRVGIGTVAPDRTLTVVGEGEAALNVRDSSGTHEVMLGIDEAGGVVATMTEHDLQLRAGWRQARDDAQGGWPGGHRHNCARRRTRGERSHQGRPSDRGRLAAQPGPLRLLWDECARSE